MPAVSPKNHQVLGGVHLLAGPLIPVRDHSRLERYHSVNLCEGLATLLTIMTDSAINGYGTL